MNTIVNPDLRRLTNQALCAVHDTELWRQTLGQLYRLGWWDEATGLLDETIARRLIGDTERTIQVILSISL